MAISTVHYEGIPTLPTLSEVFTWQRQVFQADNSWYNGPTENGVITSPYLRAEANGAVLPVYASRATFSTHSFAYILVDEDTDFPIRLHLTLAQKRNRVVVLPEGRGVKAAITGDFDVDATLDGYGSFSFVFDHYVEGAFTIMVEKRARIPVRTSKREIYPGYHAMKDTCFEEENTVYVLKAGRHEIEHISLPSHSSLFLEEGAYLKVRYLPENGVKTIIASRNTADVAILGHGLIDYSAVPSSVATGFALNHVKGITVQNLTLINCMSWCLCFTNSERVFVRDILDIAYRIFSDGIMLSDCVQGEVCNCFLRTGDDAAECKSTGDGSTRTNDIYFHDLDAWTDKAVAYGIVFEDNYDTHNVRYERCNVGFALPNWSRHLGAVTVNTGNNPNACDYDISFTDTEVYYTLSSAITICAYEGAIRDVRVKNLSVRHNFHEDPVLIWLRDGEKAAIGRIDLENITVAGVRLCEENRDDMIAVLDPDGKVDRKDIHIL